MQQSKKRGHSRLPQAQEEQQHRLAAQFSFPHFGIDTQTAWLHCHTVQRSDEHTPSGVVYSHRRYSRPLLVQLCGEEYLVAYQDTEDSIGFQPFEQTRGDDIEAALRVIEKLYEQMPLLDDPCAIDLLECAFCQFWGIAVQPLDWAQERRVLTVPEHVAVMQVEGHSS